MYKNEFSGGKFTRPPGNCLCDLFCLLKRISKRLTHSKIEPMVQWKSLFKVSKISTKSKKRRKRTSRGKNPDGLLQLINESISLRNYRCYKNDIVSVNQSDMHFNFAKSSLSDVRLTALLSR